MMSDRYKGFAVMLDRDVLEDDAQSTLDAIRHIKGVVSVEPVMAEGMSETITIMRAKQEIANVLLNVIEDFKRDGV